jgi:hypothetical protein
VFPVRYEQNFQIVCRRNYVLKSLIPHIISSDQCLSFPDVVTFSVQNSVYIHYFSRACYMSQPSLLNFNTLLIFNTSMIVALLSYMLS